MSSEGEYERELLLSSVAESYYLAKESQDEIATKYGFSRSNISRMLSEARDKGIVQISVKQPLPLDSDLSTRLRAIFPTIKFTVTRQGATTDESSRFNGMATWRLLKQHLKPNSLVNLSWGRSIWAMVQQARPLAASGARVIQIGGLQDAQDTNSSRNAAAYLGRKLGIEVVNFPAPLLADDVESARIFAQQTSVRSVIAMAERAECTMVGIGAIVPEDRVGRESRFDESSLRTLRESGAVGDICGYHFDENGDIVSCEMNDRVIGVGHATFMKLRNRIAVANGQVKSKAIRAALNGGWIDHLVTDSATASLLLTSP